MASLPSNLINLKNRKTAVFSLLLLTLLIVVIGVWYFYTNQTAATVNGQVITKADFERRVASQTYFYTSVSPSEEKLKTVKKDVLDFFINTALMEQELKKYGGKVTNVEVEDVYKDKAEEHGGVDKYKTFLDTTYKMTPDEMKQVIRFDLLKEELTSHDASAHLYGIWFIKKSPGDKAEKDLTAAEKAANQEVKARADAALVRVKNGEDFAALAKELSEDPISKAKGGDLGVYSHFTSASSFNTPNQSSPLRVFPSVAVMEQALQTLKEGESNIFDYLTGYGLVKATEVKDGFKYQTIEQFFEAEKEKADINTLIEL